VRKTLTLLSAAGAGALFAAGLALGGMTDPARVQGFLDFSPRWDPALVWVMAGAVATHLLLRRLATRSLRQPVFADSFPRPTHTRVDARLIVGSLVFGAGWGLAGLCPGPAVTALGTGTAGVAVFLLALLGALAAARGVERWSETRQQRLSPGQSTVRGLSPEPPAPKLSPLP
jgi:uncharacterized membrane protein YedE/YeeE